MVEDQPALGSINMGMLYAVPIRSPRVATTNATNATKMRRASKLSPQLRRGPFGNRMREGCMQYVIKDERKTTHVPAFIHVTASPEINPKDDSHQALSNAQVE